MNTAMIAAVWHEANRMYCLGLGDQSQATWGEAPEWQRQSAMSGVANIQCGYVTQPEQSHESWLVEKARDGWIYGSVKNAQTKEHPCFVPYAELPLDQQKKDALFFAIVSALK